jgi:ABC-type Na+ efflux pump permease subunit
VRSQPFERCTAESSTLVENKNLSNSDGEPSRPNDHAELDFSKNAQEAGRSLHRDNRSQGENDFPSTKSVSHSDIESPPGVRRPLDTQGSSHPKFSLSSSSSSSSSFFFFFFFFFLIFYLFINIYF